eukprot:6485315-Amphidinium_carterae.1
MDARRSRHSNTSACNDRTNQGHSGKVCCISILKMSCGNLFRTVLESLQTAKSRTRTRSLVGLVMLRHRDRSNALDCEI